MEYKYCVRVSDIYNVIPYLRVKYCSQVCLVHNFNMPTNRNLKMIKGLTMHTKGNLHKNTCVSIQITRVTITVSKYYESTLCVGSVLSAAASSKAGKV